MSVEPQQVSNQTALGERALRTVPKPYLPFDGSIGAVAGRHPNVLPLARLQA